MTVPARESLALALHLVGGRGVLADLRTPHEQEAASASLKVRACEEPDTGIVRSSPVAGASHPESWWLARRSGR